MQEYSPDGKKLPPSNAPYHLAIRVRKWLIAIAILVALDRLGLVDPVAISRLLGGTIRPAPMLVSIGLVATLSVLSCQYCVLLIWAFAPGRRGSLAGIVGGREPSRRPAKASADGAVSLPALPGSRDGTDPASSTVVALRAGYLSPSAQADEELLKQEPRPRPRGFEAAMDVTRFLPAALSAAAAFCLIALDALAASLAAA